ncbi:uncharacterized protein LOC113521859 isoform X1 [Galleria mellonella]|uniref:Uncharacterized protein LOC113521859 isoform X1 n=1 Tax=Galleria mellonella TaxID=7137 RepID=A0A6J3BWW6_GALME|nr:uncharacterized protein LOC113521859 isoform X1 [Galleria mellonella]
MWSFFVILVFGCSWVEGQNGREEHNHEHHGNGWDIRLAVPGEPGSDYPILGTIPKTSFSCAGREPGYYADLETNCQVFRICTVGSTYGFQSFLCPNGTLFNQAVFVCDWWMNVNCEKSEELFNNNNERFGNLRLGPQLMKDVKKMLMHPMRNPYDKTTMKSNLVVMQTYKPPFGQMYPNAALLAYTDRTPKNVYLPPQQLQSPIQNGDNNDISFSASTPQPLYLPASFNAAQNTPQGEAEVFQRQKEQRTHHNQFKNIITSSQSDRFAQNSNALNSNNNNYSQITRPIQRNNVLVNAQYGQKQEINTNPTFVIPNQTNNPKGQVSLQNSQYDNNFKFTQFNTGKQQQYSSNQDNEAYIYNTPTPRFNEITKHEEAKQNLVSTKGDTIPPTIITRTLTFSRLVNEPKPGKPKSRVTVKTWIVKPKPKSAKVIQATSTSYTYDRPTRAPTETLTDPITPYIYRKPVSTFSQSQVILETEKPYIYSRPTIAAKQKITPDVTPYPFPTVESQVTVKQTSPLPTKASRLYLVPTTFKPAAKLYLPPLENESPSPIILSRQYLSPNSMPQPTYYSGQLRVAPTSAPVPTYTIPTTVTTNEPPFSIMKRPRVNNNQNNLTFTDILTKEKLDITVNDIVKDTSKFLSTAPSGQYGQYKQEIAQSNYPEDNYLPPHESIESVENLTSQIPTIAPSSSRLVVSPSVDLEPPEESYDIKQSNNELSNLPFFKEPPFRTNTIERTVSLKITIPEKVASYLFRKRNESDFDRLEILNTGSSNYLVLTNNPFTKSNSGNFIPIGKLIEDKNSSISNSQALVFSLLADSINIAKEYNNVIHENMLPTPKIAQFQNVNSEQLAQITNTISQLTSSQYSGNNYNNINKAKIISTPLTPPNTGYQYRELAEQVTKNQQQIQSNDFLPSTIPTPQQTNQNIFMTQFQNGKSNLNSNYQTHMSDQNQIYSGQLYQLPVPDVIDQIYNRQSFSQSSANNAQSQVSSNLNNINNVRSSSTEIETVKSKTMPARLQLPPSDESNNIHENINKYLSPDNTISAQIRDKIVGTIVHPLEDNKLVNYEKDQTYIVYSKANNVNGQTNSFSLQTSPVQNQQRARLIQGTSMPNQISFQLIPSIGYQLEDEKEQQKILNAFQINEFGSPKTKTGQIVKSNTRQDIIASDINYTVDHTSSTNNQINSQYNNINSLYAGPSSYSAPQSSIGNLIQRQDINSRSELNENNGYSRIIPERPYLV